MDSKQQEFYSELNDEIKQYRISHDFVTANVAFKQVFLSYLAEQVPELADMNLVEYKRDSENMRLDGYSYSDYFHSLTLLVGKYESKPEPEKLWKKDIDKYLNKAVKFLKTCNTLFFQSIEPTSDGYQAYEAIKKISRDIESVTVIFITNDIAKNYVPEEIKYKGTSIKFDVFDVERLYQIVFSGDIEYKPTEIRLKNKYHQELTMIRVAGENDIYDCYVGVIPGVLLAQIYKDEGQDLIQKNVRSYLLLRPDYN